MLILHPRDLYFGVVFGIVWGSSRWPLSPAKPRIVRAISRLAYHCAWRRRARAEQGLALALGSGIPDATRREIVRGMFEQFWQEVSSLVLSREERAKLGSVALYGVEHVQSALAAGKGVILWESGWFGRRLLAKQVLHRAGFSIDQVHGERHVGGFFRRHAAASWVSRKLLERVARRWERRWVHEIIELPESGSLAFTRTLLGRLRRNAIVCITAEGQLGEKRVAMSFLNQTILFATGMVSLARLSGATILPIFSFREPDGRVRVVVEAPIYVDTAGERERTMAASIGQYVSRLEDYVRRYPEQYCAWDRGASAA